MSEQTVLWSVEQRIVIKFLIGENVPSAEIHHRPQQQYGEECLSRTCVFEWCKCFREGRERVQNEPHDCWPRISVTKPNIDRVDALIRENRCITIKELGAMLSISVDLLATDVKEKIQSKRKRGGKRVAFLQDNARRHTAKTTMVTLRKLKCNLLTHPPYSPNLAPSDFYLFGRLKSDLQGMQFVDDAVIQTVREWKCRQPQAFLKMASGCFQNIGKNVLTLEGSTLKTDMCK
ncbi:hypothetical protein B7P43_G04790 [Cryptotermes secundus]|uniref:Mos1 transposase HTH domain-containing protein n=1 Tax=Cryptotermes secundus TaxID=105785 RepID=A0A2J7PUV0_9NEOP|nr:hypothetical protein B7P43_G04790 [Cryptotermes secundus]